MGSLHHSYPSLLPELQTEVGVLGSKLSSSNATWKIVFGHHPLYTQGKRHHTEAQILREQCGLDEVLAKNLVSAYFCGHEHVFQHHRSQDVDHFGCGASGAE